MGTKRWIDAIVSAAIAGAGVVLVLSFSRMAASVEPAPLAADDQYTVLKNGSFTLATPGVLANDSDPQGDPIRASLVAGPSSGTLVLSGNGSFTYIPGAGVVGTDSFQYRAYDTAGNLSNVATVLLRITETGSGKPVGGADVYFTPPDTPLVIDTLTSGVLRNDVDPDGDTLMARWSAGPANGALRLNYNGTLRYTPNAGFIGIDTFTYRAYDGQHSAPVTVSLLVGTASRPPVATNDQYTGKLNTSIPMPLPGILVNDTDPDGDRLSAILVSGPTSGTFVLNSNGSFTYTPNTGFLGTDSFTYQASDGVTRSNVATVLLRITVLGNHKPIGSADAYATPSDTPLDVPPRGVLNNDSDPQGDTLMARLSLLPSSGTLLFNYNGSFRYTPNPGFNGADAFMYKPFDTQHGLATLVTIRVGEERAPISANDQYTVKLDTLMTLASPGVLANDADPEADPMTAVLVSGPTSGTLVLNSNGSFTYTPNAGFLGTDSFTYRANDGRRLGNIATVLLRVTVAGNTRPVSTPDTYTVRNSETLVVLPPGVLANDFDADGDTLMARYLTYPAHGTIDFNFNGGFRYKPTTGYVGTDSINFRVYDGLHSPLTALTFNIVP
jgi:hypothetical protein